MIPHVHRWITPVPSRSRATRCHSEIPDEEDEEEDRVKEPLVVHKPDED